MGAIDAAKPEIDPPGDGEASHGAYRVPGEVLPGRVAAEEARGVEDLLARAGSERHAASDGQRLPPRVDDPRGADSVAGGGDAGADVEVKRLVARDPGVGVARMRRGREECGGHERLDRRSSHCQRNDMKATLAHRFRRRYWRSFQREPRN